MQGRRRDYVPVVGADIELRQYPDPTANMQSWMSKELMQAAPAGLRKPRRRGSGELAKRLETHGTIGVEHDYV
jgi:hypothetical protein